MSETATRKVGPWAFAGVIGDLNDAGAEARPLLSEENRIAFDRYLAAAVAVLDHARGAGQTGDRPRRRKDGPMSDTTRPLPAADIAGGLLVACRKVRYVAETGAEDAAAPGMRQLFQNIVSIVSRAIEKAERTAP